MAIEFHKPSSKDICIPSATLSFVYDQFCSQQEIYIGVPYIRRIRFLWAEEFMKKTY